MIEFIRTTWIDPVTLKTYGYVLFPSLDEAKEFVENTYTVPLPADGGHFMMPFPARAEPRHGLGTSFIADTIAVCMDGPVMEASYYGRVICVVKSDSETFDLWREASSTHVVKSEPVAFVKAPRFAELDENGDGIMATATVVGADVLQKARAVAKQTAERKKAAPEQPTQTDTALILPFRLTRE